MLLRVYFMPGLSQANRFHLTCHSGIEDDLRLLKEFNVREKRGGKCIDGTFSHNYQHQIFNTWIREA